MFLGVGVVALSWAAPLIRLTRGPAVVVAAWRLLLAGALLSPWGVRGWRGLPWRFPLAAGLCLATHFALWIQSLRLTSVASSVALVTTNPLFVGLFSLALGERPGAALWAGILLSVGGSFLIAWGDVGRGGSALLGDLLALLGAVAASAYLLVGRRARARTELLPYVSLAYFVAGGLLGVVAAGLGHPLPPAEDWPWLVLLALVPQALGHTAVNWALRHLPPAAVAVAILGEPVGAALWAFLLFGEGIGPWQGVGMALVLGGIAWALRGVRL
ncbi:DMT family transporter [Thermus sp.]|uniref:DMT family transporter n=1 Tax=Thermus sp. TaxID=275 RepID=UPI002625E726|nr:DMT family transporter [Thermus sp.]MCX7850293.1 DMT family transporter [Thermus sp.]